MSLPPGEGNPASGQPGLLPDAPRALPLRPVRGGRRAAAPAPGTPGPPGRGRALAGAAVSLAGVLLGIGTLLWATDSGGGTPAATGPPTHTSVAAPPAGPSAAAGSAAPVASPPPAGTTTGAGSQAVAPPLTSAPPGAADGAAAESTAGDGTAGDGALSDSPQAPSLPPLTVLNNSRISHLAERAATRFRGAGWPVAGTGNLTGRVPATTLYYPPRLRPQALQLAARFRGISQVQPRDARSPGTGLTLVVTRDFPA